MAMLPPPPSPAAAVRTCPPRARQQQRAAAGSCAGMPAQSIFTLAAPPADFLRRFRDDGYCAFPGAISPGGCDALEADMKGCLQTKAWCAPLPLQPCGCPCPRGCPLPRADARRGLLLMDHVQCPGLPMDHVQCPELPMADYVVGAAGVSVRWTSG